MDIIIHFFRSYPEMAIFLTLGIGFWIGSLKYKNFSLGTVTSVLLVGVLVGQMNIDIPGPLKSVFFLLFLFAIGYSVGPQFFQSLRSDGIHQVIFACIFGIVCIGSTYLIAKIMGYNAGMTIGLFAGAQTISAAIGVGTDTIGTLGISAEKTTRMVEYHTGLLCRHLHFRNHRLGLHLRYTRSSVTRWTRKSKKRYPGT